MSGSFGPQLPSPFPSANALLDMERLRQAPQIAEDAHLNALMTRQVHQQTLGTNQIEYVARASAAIDGVPEADQPALYQQLGQQLVDAGIIPTLPPYPGPARIKQLASLGTPAEKQQERQGNLAGNAALLNGITGATPPTATPGTTTGTVAPAGDIEVPAQQRARAVYDGMIKRGADHATASAWAANALHESAANPSTGPGDQGASQGLFMWNGPRLQAYQAKYGHSPQGAPLDEQLDFVTHELGGTEAAAAARIAQASPADKAAAISREFLRPKDREGEQQRRSATAQQLGTLWQPQQAVTASGGGRVQVASATPTTATDAVPGPPGATPAATPGGYTPQQKAALAALAADPKTTRTQFVAAMAKYDDDNRANASAARVEGHQAQTLQLSRETAAREQERLRIAQQEAETKPDRVLTKYADKIANDTATHEERQFYSLAAQHYLKPTMTWGDDPTDPSRKVMVQVPGQMPSGFPHPDFKPGQQPPPPPTATKTADVKPLPEAERKVLLETAGKLDQVNEQVSTFKPDYAGFANATVGDLANTAARNLPASKVAVDRANWWSDYQRYKLAVRQGISGQSLTETEKSEFDKADINPGMTPEVVRRNLEHQGRILRTANERRVGSLVSDRYNPDAIKAASGLDPATVRARPVDAPPPSQPQKNPLPPGWTVKIP